MLVVLFDGGSPFRITKNVELIVIPRGAKDLLFRCVLGKDAVGGDLGRDLADVGGADGEQR